ncbi:MULTISPECIES: hypothetical protein [unclassified Lentimonas]|uniref:hypothetical protein n=1 Tax=unclassified Lentimonas TaxID=2630993 RepID=UPI001328A46F|nr:MULTISPECIES: hypothetical protein [unclassified Lentimonas]CAA6689441.1 Unannotated [Lentimonas sp. CC10]CAA6696414.1 Unannotated [Lentimonas sp. CC19]CAA7070506.1 Unannotated [Lentimonas sp. CC11]
MPTQLQPLLNKAILAFILLTNMNAQPNIQQEWLHGHGTDHGEHVIEGIQCTDGGYLAVGKTEERIGRHYDILIIKVDALGALQWQQIIGQPSQNDEARSVVETDDGYVIAGCLGLDKTRSQPAIIKLDKNGAPLWRQSYPCNRSGALRSIARATEDTFVATGYIDSPRPQIPFIAEDSTGLLIKIDSSGSPIWERALTTVAQGSKVKVDPHTDGYAIASTIWSATNDIDHQDALLLLTDVQGMTQRSYHIGSTADEQCYDFAITQTGYALAGHRRANAESGWDVWLQNISTSGETIWEQHFAELIGGNPHLIFDECYGIQIDTNGSFWLAAGSGIEPENVTDSNDPFNTWAAIVLKIAPSGHKIAQYIHHTPHAGHNAAEYLQLTSDGGCIVFLDTDSTGTPEESNFGFLKLQRSR